MEVRIVIKGAKYFTGDRILIPHMTGEFFIVDCDEYVTLEELKEDYDEVDTYFNAKWYQCEEEIGDISFKHPELEFTIYCRGEDGEMWVVYGL